MASLIAQACVQLFLPRHSHQYLRRASWSKGVSKWQSSVTLSLITKYINNPLIPWKICVSIASGIVTMGINNTLLQNLPVFPGTGAAMPQSISFVVDLKWTRLCFVSDFRLSFDGRLVLDRPAARCSPRRCRCSGSLPSRRQRSSGTWRRTCSSSKKEETPKNSKRQEKS